MFRVTHTPQLSALLDGLTTRSIPTIAKHLGITEQTMRRYIRQDKAPRAIMLALYYEGHSGVRDLETDAFNAARRSASEAASAQKQIRNMRARISYLEGLSTFGSANDPAHRPEDVPGVATELYEGPHGRKVVVGPSRLHTDRYWA